MGALSVWHLCPLTIPFFLFLIEAISEDYIIWVAELCYFGIMTNSSPHHVVNSHPSAYTFKIHLLINYILVDSLIHVYEAPTVC